MTSKQAKRFVDLIAQVMLLGPDIMSESSKSEIRELAELADRAELVVHEKPNLARPDFDALWVLAGYGDIVEQKTPRTISQVLIGRGKPVVKKQLPAPPNTSHRNCRIWKKCCWDDGTPIVGKA